MKTENDKRMPDLKSLLSQREQPSQLSILHAVAAKHGLQIKRVPRGR